MKIIGDCAMSAAVGGLALIIGTANPASAASPAYCALYAREYTAQFATGSSADAAMASEYRIQEQAYYQCLNMDVEPEFPATSVYFGGTIDDVLGGGPYETVAQGDAAVDETDPVVEPPVVKPKPKRTASVTAPRRSGGGSGLEAWTPAWQAWCQAHFPNSFDADTGTVKPYGEDRRFCR